jgi:5-methylcytosine-specific restriction endonuclease McrA
MSTVHEALAVLEAQEAAARERREQSSAGRYRRFYNSWAWKKLRFAVLRERGRKCECCNATAVDGAPIVVDHVVAIKKDWSRRLDKTNLQVLSDCCNRGKCQLQTDFRVPSERAA